MPPVFPAAFFRRGGHPSRVFLPLDGFPVGFPGGSPPRDRRTAGRARWTGRRLGVWSPSLPDAEGGVPLLPDPYPLI